MRKLIFILLAVATLSSCSIEAHLCHAYGDTNRTTKHGAKAQSKYAKHNKHRV